MAREAKRIAAKLTTNFADNLASIERFLTEADAPQAYDALLYNLLETTIPNLERFPDIGRAFLNRETRSVETINAVAGLRKKLAVLTPDSTALREYVMANYLLLYAQIEEAIYLLAIKHHRQLSFDFDAHGLG
jgi:hypothetical protein